MKNINLFDNYRDSWGKSVSYTATRVNSSFSNKLLQKF